MYSLKVKRTIFILTILLTVNGSICAQEENQETEKNNMITLAIGHTQVVKGVKNGKRIWLALPSWAVDYSYKINKRWLIALQNEIILSDFEVESNNESGRTIERTNPISSIITAGYSPFKHAMIFAGAGMEFAKEDNFFVLRLGIEPTIEITEKLEFILSLAYDYKIEGYDSFSTSFGLGYKF